MLPEPSAEIVAGVRAWLWRAKAPQCALLFIPGNPGVSAYYKEYLSHVYELLGGTCTILCKGSPGHDFTTPQAPPPTGTYTRTLTRPFAYYGLRDQIASQAEALETLRRLVPPRTPVIVQGHSMGAYVAMHVCAARHGQWDALHMLFPTVCHIAKAPQARITRRYLYTWALAMLQAVTYLLALLPLAWHVALIQCVTKQSPLYAAVSAEFVRRPHAVRTALCTFVDELNMITDITPDMEAALSGKALRAYWGTGDTDTWATSWHKRYTDQALHLTEWSDSRHTPPPGMRTTTECSDGLPHAFGLVHSALFAQTMSRWIQSDAQAT